MNVMIEENKNFSKEFLFDKLSVVQPESGYRFSIDPVVLCACIQSENADEVLDIGSGCGIMSLILSRLKGFKRFTCVEIQDDLHKCAQLNIKNENLQDKINLIYGDIVDYKRFLKKKKFDLIISNPPFYRVSSGRINPLLSRAVARHEITMTMEELLKAGRALLTKEGKFAVIYPVVRLFDLVEKSIKLKFPIVSLTFIYPRAHNPARSFVAILKKQKTPAIIIKSPVYIHEIGSKIHGKEIIDLIKEMKV